MRAALRFVVDVIAGLLSALPYVILCGIILAAWIMFTTVTW